MAVERELQEAAVALVKRREAFLGANTVEAADALSTSYRGTLTQKYTEGGVLLAVPAQLDKAVEEDCRRRDREADAEGRAIDLEHDTLAQRIATEVAAHEGLPSLATRYGVNTERGLTALMVDSVRERNIRDDVRGLSHGELLALYENLRDEADGDNAALRFIEAAVVDRRLERLQLRDDPDGIATDLPRLLAAVKARRAARVPEAVRQAAETLATVRTATFTQLVQHFKSGRGVHARPKPSLRVAG